MKNLIILVFVLLSFSTMAIDHKVVKQDGYDYGNFDETKLVWLNDIQKSFNAKNVASLVCMNGDRNLCRVVCESEFYDRVSMLTVGNDGVRDVLAFYYGNDKFTVTRTHQSCFFESLAPMINYSVPKDD